MDKPVMTPAPGEHLLRFVGDRARFSLGALPKGWRGFLRTTLGRGKVLRQEIVYAHKVHRKLANAPWRDIPMEEMHGDWSREICLVEPGFFKAKAYALDPQGRQHWPEGPDVGISIHPDRYRSANTIYCAFTRMFGETREATRTAFAPAVDESITDLDKAGFTVIPPSGKLRDLIATLPHIFEHLGCRILHLLPVNPTPTTYARFGRFGSPYAALNLTGIDPALVEFDKKTTGVDQFRELTYAVHQRGGRVFLDIVANHTGWSSLEHEMHPEWFLRDEDGEFESPGAWGVTWEDLVELDHRNPALWEYLAEVFLTWCHRGVDGFRCDAGYKIPPTAWRYITARVIEEYPETVFLLEGLGGAWEATEKLLTDGGMQWAYSELFQNYSGEQVAAYLDYCLKQCEGVGVYVHYSETHDNERLAAKGKDWSLLRNRLCALASVNGAFGFTCGVEWLAPERVNVHSSRGLAWGNEQNIVPELAALNRLLAEHPCFLDGAKLTRVSPAESPVFALGRESAEGLDNVLVLVNTDDEKSHPFVTPPGAPTFDLLTGKRLQQKKLTLAAGESLCLAEAEKPRGLMGDAYRRARAVANWAIAAISEVVPSDEIGPFDWRKLAEWVEADPRKLLEALGQKLATVHKDLIGALQSAAVQARFPQIVTWSLIDARRITPVPSDHWLMVEDEAAFRVSLLKHGSTRHLESTLIGPKHLAVFPPQHGAADAFLTLERYGSEPAHLTAAVRFLGGGPSTNLAESVPPGARSEVALLTNGIGGMARMQVNLGAIKSKYDCVLGANLHPQVPVDRHILVKRVRVWVVADGFISALNQESLALFSAGPPATWRFIAGAGDGRSVEIQMSADMLHGENTTVLKFSRPAGAPADGHDLPHNARVTLTVRVDIEDRNFHHETHRNPGADHHFGSNTRSLPDHRGFEFTPAADRQLRVQSDTGIFNAEPEWSHGIAHPVETSRGLPDHSDVYSPGWFELPMSKGAQTSLILTANPKPVDPARVANFETERKALNDAAANRARLPASDTFGRQLAQAIHAFVARRGAGKTVIAGYPWFLDWGRDSLICARGMLAAGMVEEVKQLLITYGRFADRGTLPNSIFGEDASNRSTSDAPLWYGLVCEEIAALAGPDVYGATVDEKGRTIRNVLEDIATGYRDGTANGIRMDPASALIWSPSHFTWMDTNYPAGTPREGYPIEIQVLWARLLRQLGWTDLAQQAETKLQSDYWLEDRGYYADCLLAPQQRPAADAVVDNSLRSNFLFGISLGLFNGDRARRAVDAALKYLLVPGGLRTLAPLPVFPPLPIFGPGGELLNDPKLPYAPQYLGDEDTRRKPAYHNGTAWVWTFPSLCEALVRAWQFDPAAVAAAKAYLGSLDRPLIEGCANHLPEIMDGDAPHIQRGCDAQAWSVTEALRVWKILNSHS
ncbi:MAG TPA: amylo-alpha-1,6-glucosidase [Verrucomicrobiae bacterium]|nr:amylo-alpha-1,6-glucosidase [Verrucomicrobiae bacterium]